MFSILQDCRIDLFSTTCISGLEGFLTLFGIIASLFAFLVFVSRTWLQIKTSVTKLMRKLGTLYTKVTFILDKKIHNSIAAYQRRRHCEQARRNIATGAYPNALLNGTNWSVATDSGFGIAVALSLDGRLEEAIKVHPTAALLGHSMANGIASTLSMLDAATASEAVAVRTALLKIREEIANPLNELSWRLAKIEQSMLNAIASCMGKQLASYIEESAFKDLDDWFGSQRTVAVSRGESQRYLVNENTPSYLRQINERDSSLLNELRKEIRLELRKFIAEQAACEKLDELSIYLYALDCKASETIRAERAELKQATSL